jgi:hypothetical protein
MLETRCFSSRSWCWKVISSIADVQVVMTMWVRGWLYCQWRL